MRFYCPNQKVDSYKKHVIEGNRKYWNNIPNIIDGSEWIYVFHGIPNAFEIALHEIIVAKGLQERKQLPIVAVTYSTPQKVLDELDSSFGIRDILHLEFYKFKSLWTNIRTSIIAGYYSRTTYKRKKKLFQMKYRGVSCGEAIHDEIIRINCLESRGEQFDCFDISLPQYYQYIKDGLSVIDKSYEMFRKRKPRYVVSTEYAYVKNLFLAVASLNGAELLFSDTFFPNIIMRITPRKDLLKNIYISDFLRTQGEAFNKMVKVQDGPADNVFVEKTVENSEVDLIEELGLRNGKKNVFIMLHSLPDACREGSRQTFYDDYNEWFLDTLKIITGITDVNWIIKDHPFSTYYAQDNYVKKIFDKNKTENMYWCDKNISGMEIKEIADCVITCCGDVGIEYWSYGIPTITTSETFYCGWGISYNMKSRREYENTLQNISLLEPPQTKSRKLARNILTALKEMKRGGDELTCLFREATAVQHWLCAELGEIQDFPMYCFCRRYLMFLKNSVLESSEIYQLKNVIDVRTVQED